MTPPETIFAAILGGLLGIALGVVFVLGLMYLFSKKA